MADDLFQGLPPPSSAPSPPPEKRSPSPIERDSPPPPPPAPAPILKSALKRDKPSDSHDQAPQKRLRFKTSVDATEAQVTQAMHKIASHIKNRAKFGKASKLAMQLIQAGSVKPGTSNQFFDILEAAMSSPLVCNEPSLRMDYQALFSAVQDVADVFNKQQRNQLATWTLRAVVANDLYTDDSFVYSKAAGKIKEAISSLPQATADDDNEEAAALALAENNTVGKDTAEHEATSSDALTETDNNASDPFGLDSLLPSKSKKDEQPKTKDALSLSRKASDDGEHKRFIKSQREVLLLCLDTAARRYKVPWCQTVIDILVKHAFDNIDRFTSQQRDAIEKLWASIREQHIRRKQGKSVTGKLDMNAFEWLQEKYANEKISIRHAVGGSGERRAQQWLG
ncbi:uncharacterized protein LOC121967429 isoform X1 [Zingiber officinale]|uniref:Uncharacterized protein n=1 Tax=Zingiber officinale TaxID=94328 RepID=A0A8J5HE20_ZINOF|nr:uncharacterized protein LOC121967429 isoform X1 [Zingiber officinale]KAG6519262.1 hypothetical protein ZIOFF_022755 [Zingiber officinale]